MDNVLSWGFVAFGALAVAGFVWASIRSTRRYEDSVSPPDDLKRADQSPGGTRGAPPGGSIWPDNH